MKKHDVKLGYSHYRGYYHHNNKIYLAVTSTSGISTGEMCVEWENRGHSVIPVLKCSHDSFNILPYFKDVLNEISKYDSTIFDQTTFNEILDKLNIVNETTFIPVVIPEEIFNKYKKKLMREKNFKELDI